MLLVSSLAALILATTGIATIGDPATSPNVFEALVVVGTMSAFVTICTAEARLAS